MTSIDGRMKPRPDNKQIGATCAALFQCYPCHLFLAAYTNYSTGPQMVILASSHIFIGTQRDNLTLCFHLSSLLFFFLYPFPFPPLCLFSKKTQVLLIITINSGPINNNNIYRNNPLRNIEKK